MRKPGPPPGRRCERRRLGNADRGAIGAELGATLGSPRASRGVSESGSRTISVSGSASNGYAASTVGMSSTGERARRSLWASVALNSSSGTSRMLARLRTVQHLLCEIPVGLRPSRSGRISVPSFPAQAPPRSEPSCGYVCRIRRRRDSPSACRSPRGCGASCCRTSSGGSRGCRPKD